MSVTALRFLKRGRLSMCVTAMVTTMLSFTNTAQRIDSPENSLLTKPVLTDCDKGHFEKMRKLLEAYGKSECIYQ